MPNAKWDFVKETREAAKKAGLGPDNELYQREDVERECEDTTTMLALQEDDLEKYRSCFEERYGKKLPALNTVPFAQAYKCKAISIIGYLISLYGGEAYMDCLLENSCIGIWGAFCEAARLDDMSLLEYLVNEKGANLENCRHGDSKLEQDFQFPIHAAIKNGNLEMVRYLVEKCKCDPCDDSKRDGSTALYATKQNQLEIVYYLITECGESVISLVLNLAEEKLFKQAFDFIDMYDMDWDYLSHVLCASPNKNVFSFLKKLHSKYDLDLSYEDEDGYTILAKALQCGRLQIVKWLVEECGDDVNAVSVNGNEALILAVQSSNFDLIRYLVEECVVNVDSKDNEGETALICAINGSNKTYKKNFKICQYLINWGANVNAKSKRGRNILHYSAAGPYDCDMFKWFVQAGADVNVIDKDGNSPLQIATEKGKLRIVRFLVEDCGVSSGMNQPG